MAQLAIKGHETRGKEVIEILEMLGGKNKYNVDAIRGHHVYFIENGIIFTLKINQIRPNQFIVFTLEEFLEENPFKVGDFVSIPEYETEVRIYEMHWDGFGITYKVYRVDEEEWYTSDELLDYNDNLNRTIKDMEEKLTAIPEITTLNMSAIDYNNGLVGYEIPAGYEFDTVIDNKVVLKPIKPQYPKTYEECCGVLGIDVSRTIGHSGDCPFYMDVTCYENNLLSRLTDLRKLLICRDAYWKIAGDWKPDWLNAEQDKHVIFTHNNAICSNRYVLGHNILAFPTEEMRDAFYENFKEPIKECISLL